MRLLKKKVILIISSEIWSEILVSKHHYAINLAKCGNSIFFLNPMERSLEMGSIHYEESGFNNLQIIRYNPVLPEIIKFKLPFLFQINLRWICKKILQKIGPIDIVWDFNTYSVFDNLDIFNAKIKILHPVDSSVSKVIKSRNADIAFSVSTLILNMIDDVTIGKHLINHGVSDDFIRQLDEADDLSLAGPLRVCYVGNLLIHSIDHKTILLLVDNNPDVEFHFFGPYESKGKYLIAEGSEDSISFINKLKVSSNVKLYGRKSNSEIAKIIRKFHLYLICYKDTIQFQSDNSHKILEYLAAGNVIMSSFISYYEKSDLLLMAKKNKNEDLIRLFNSIKDNINAYNSEELRTKRIKYAEENTYYKQLERIDLLLNGLQK